ncbi:hypothetical protein F9C28_11900 [Shimwellia pseudoproteus]|uniref:metallophosphoesterase n=1 Tax=Shimwellia pseudoproteus TaxID=570012 RepID=UPI0018EBD150|nr:metallophosphoesterase [Shimwellia pseudoproteus]MBJ3815612.1 hypothetical protein [Shimwellia pseudoproteus]
MAYSGVAAPRKIFIGDIHGQHDKLAALLAELHTRRLMDNSTLIFIGDLIDNHPGEAINHLAVLAQVKQLVDSGQGICLMGNHEFNAVGWAMRHPETGQPLRAHSEHNRRQHQAFLQQLAEGSPEHMGWIDWFRTLPLFMDFGDIRAVHACWDANAIESLRPWLDHHNRLKPAYWAHAFDKHHALFHLLERVLKGPEIRLPAGYSFVDKTGTERRNIRARWWCQDAVTYRQAAQVQPAMVNNIPDLPLAQPAGTPPDVPVVIGHYTLHGTPQLLSDSVICVDYNAAKAGHPLVAWIYDSNHPAMTAQGFISAGGG